MAPYRLECAKRKKIVIALFSSEAQDKFAFISKEQKIKTKERKACIEMKEEGEKEEEEEETTFLKSLFSLLQISKNLQSTFHINLLLIVFFVIFREGESVICN